LIIILRIEPELKQMKSIRNELFIGILRNKLDFK